ncbi:MAG: sulfatase-like hydrolase/transferase [Oscillibacter sp.]|nr:sulfatase-like hydrolase/transferase [Oscillibacter sp.]
MRSFWLFQASCTGLDKKKTAFFWAWNFFLVLASGICLGGVSLLFAYGSYSPNVFYSYFTHPLILALNLAPVVGLEMLLWCLTGRSALSFFLTGFVTLGFSIGNYFKLLFRDDPLMFQDMRNIREALSITNTASYDLTPDKRIVFGVVCLIFGTVVLYFTARGIPGKKRRFAGAAVILLACFPASKAYTSERVYNTLTANYDHINRWAATQLYVSKGFVYPFLHSITAGAAKEPEGYDKAETAAMLAGYTDADIPEEKKVDLITIQLEAFADFSRFENVEGIDFEKAYSTFHAIEAESVTGNLITNIFAGGTVDTERAFLTGYTDLRDFRTDTNSHAWYLQSQGYTVEGSHPSYQWFYNRRNVNSYLGLPTYYYFENYYNQVDSVNLAADRLLFPEILELYRNNRGEDPYFSFNVTYQGHGPYATTENQWKGESFTDGRYSTETTFIVDNYLASVKDTAQELRIFLDELQREERSVVVVVYGDHMPWLGDGNSAYMELGADLDTSTEEGFLNYYGTRYLIWANDAAKKTIGHDFVGEGDTVSSCFLMNEVFESLGWEGSAWMQAGNEIRKTLPVITSLGRFMENGCLTDVLSVQGQEKLKAFQWMEYYLCETFLY